jgi:sialate O-acetylesterase
LALAARALAYGEKVESSGPLFREATTELQKDGRVAMRVWFDHADGLSFHGSQPGGFELAGADRHFVPAQAVIEGSSVLVTSPAQWHPEFVRFGWTGVVESNLYNSQGLPASTFSSEPAAVK